MQLFAASDNALMLYSLHESLTGLFALQFLAEKGGQHLRLLQLVDELIVPRLEEGRAQANQLPSGNREQKVLKRDCKDHLDWLHARKWTFFALAAVYYPTQKQHRIFKDHPFFQNAEAVR